MTTITRQFGRYCINLELDLEACYITITDNLGVYIYSGVHYVDMDAIEEDTFIAEMDACHSEEEIHRYLCSLE